MITLIADDHQLVREGLLLMLEKCGIAKVLQASSGKQAIQLLKEKPIDLVLLDIRMPDGDGFSVIHHILSAAADTRVIVLTGYDEEPVILNLLTLKVHGILFKKTASLDELRKAIQYVREGRCYFTEKVIQTIHARPEGVRNPPRITMSAREADIIALLAKGESTKTIANKLFLSKHTIEGYRKKILKKTNVKNTNELIAFVMANGIMPPGAPH